MTIRTSEATNELYAALSKAQGQFPIVPKTKSGKVSGTSRAGRDYDYQYKYADIADVLGCVLPVLSQNGLCVLQPTELEGSHMYITTRIAHASGQWMESDYFVADIGSDHQKMGGGLTYARRYALCSLIGIASEEDVDGEGAEGAAPEGTRLKVLRGANRTAWLDLEAAVCAAKTADEVKAIWGSENAMKLRARVPEADLALLHEIARKVRAELQAKAAAEAPEFAGGYPQSSSAGPIVDFPASNEVEKSDMPAAEPASNEEAKSIVPPAQPAPTGPTEPATATPAPRKRGRPKKEEPKEQEGPRPQAERTDVVSPLAKARQEIDAIHSIEALVELQGYYSESVTMSEAEEDTLQAWVDERRKEILGGAGYVPEVPAEAAADPADGVEEEEEGQAEDEADLPPATAEPEPDAVDPWEPREYADQDDYVAAIQAVTGAATRGDGPRLRQWWVATQVPRTKLFPVQQRNAIRARYMDEKLMEVER